MKIYIVMCRNDGEPELAFTNKVNALDYAEEFNSIGFYKVEVVEVELKKDIKEPAQPETKQEPVAWRGINFTEAEGDWLYRDIEEPFTDSNYRSVGEALYLAPPRPESLREHVDRNKEWYNIGYRVAKEELKREPLSYEEIENGRYNHLEYEYNCGFENGVRFAEQEHGITGIANEH